MNLEYDAFGYDAGIRDLEHMTQAADDVRTYVSENVAKCDKLLAMLNNDAVSQILINRIDPVFFTALVTWVKGVRDSLPEAEALSAALDEAIANYERFYLRTPPTLGS